MFTSKDIQAKERILMPIIIALSIVIPLVVAILMYMPRNVADSEPARLSYLPLFHAVLNGSTAIFLVGGLYFIKIKKIPFHRVCMLVAFALSSIFLVSYVIYHYSVPPAPYGGQGMIRNVYFFVLITHIILAASIVPLTLITLYRAFSADYAKHKKIARYTFPVWLYVAITGVVVYLMMQPYYPV